MRDSYLILGLFLVVGLLGYGWFWFVIELEEESPVAGDSEDCGMPCDCIRAR